jgi:hypothetical protein
MAVEWCPRVKAMFHYETMHLLALKQRTSTSMKRYLTPINKGSIPAFIHSIFPENLWFFRELFLHIIIEYKRESDTQFEFTHPLDWSATSRRYCDRCILGDVC